MRLVRPSTIIIAAEVLRKPSEGRPIVRAAEEEGPGIFEKALKFATKASSCWSSPKMEPIERKLISEVLVKGKGSDSYAAKLIDRTGKISDVDMKKLEKTPKSLKAARGTLVVRLPEKGLPFSFAPLKQLEEARLRKVIVATADGHYFSMERPVGPLQMMENEASKIGHDFYSLDDKQIDSAKLHRVYDYAIGTESRRVNLNPDSNQLKQYKDSLVVLLNDFAEQHGFRVTHNLNLNVQA